MLNQDEIAKKTSKTWLSKLKSSSKKGSFDHLSKSAIDSQVPVVEAFSV